MKRKFYQDNTFAIICKHEDVMSSYDQKSSYKVCNDCNEVLDFRHKRLWDRIKNLFRRDI